MSKKVLSHFQNVDPKLHTYAVKIGELDVIVKESPDNYFYRLCREIVGQQLSGKVADVIFKRFEDLFGKKKITPKAVLNISHKTFRRIGMSNAKAHYVRNLAEAVEKKEVRLDTLDPMTDEKVIQELTKVKGIGPWTAEMFLMFVLARDDVFSHGDLGLKNGFKKVYKLKKEPKRSQIEKIVKKWSPYRTYGCRILWASLELKD